MQPEGPNKSDELLQRYAKERRAQGGDFSLHPATRRLLQGEVARRFGTRTREERSRATWFSVWRSRLALGAGIAVVVVTGGWILWNSQHRDAAPMRMAKADVAPAADRLPSAARAEEAPANKESLGEIAAGPRPMTEKPVALRRLEHEMRKDEPQAGTPLARLSVAKSTATNVRKMALFDDAYSAVGTNTLTYSVSLAPAPKSAAPPDVSTFEFVPGVSFRGANSSASGASGVGAPANLGALTAGLAETGVAYGLTTNNARLADGADRFYKVSESTPQLVSDFDKLEKQKGLSDSTKVEKRPSFGAEVMDLSLPTSANAPTGPAASGVRTGGAAARGGALGPSQASESLLSLKAEAAAPTTPAPRLAPAPITTVPRAETAAQSTMRFRLVPAQAEKETVTVNALAETLNQSAEPAEGTTRVLNRFTVEQRGRTIRIIEPDGSRYDGDIDPPLAVEAKVKSDPAIGRDKDTDGLAREQAARSTEARSNQGLDYSFRATGTNVTLQQIVVVNGRVTRSTDGALATTRGAVSGGADASAADTSGVPDTTQARRFARPVRGASASSAVTTNAPVVLEGTVRIGATNVQRLRAVRER